MSRPNLHQESQNNLNRFPIKPATHHLTLLSVLFPPESHPHKTTLPSHSAKENASPRTFQTWQLFRGHSVILFPDLVSIVRRCTPFPNLLFAFCGNRSAEAAMLSERGSSFPTRLQPQRPTVGFIISADQCFSAAPPTCTSSCVGEVTRTTGATPWGQRLQPQVVDEGVEAYRWCARSACHGGWVESLGFCGCGWSSSCPSLSGPSTTPRNVS